MPPFRPKKTSKPVNFFCSPPQANTVSVVGDFNQWDAASHPMEKMPDGAWFTTIELYQGHHRYAFLVDDILTLDPRAPGVTRNDEGQRVSLMPVSGF